MMLFTSFLDQFVLRAFYQDSSGRTILAFTVVFLAFCPISGSRLVAIKHVGCLFALFVLHEHSVPAVPANLHM